MTGGCAKVFSHSATQYAYSAVPHVSGGFGDFPKPGKSSKDE
jgi:hypothetical protein